MSSVPKYFGTHLDSPLHQQFGISVGMLVDFDFLYSELSPMWQHPLSCPSLIAITVSAATITPNPRLFVLPKEPLLAMFSAVPVFELHASPLLYLVVHSLSAGWLHPSIGLQGFRDACTLMH